MLTDILGELQNRLNKQDNNHSGRMVYSVENDFFIDTDYGAYITSEDNYYRSYTFPIIGRSEITGFSNLLITIKEDDNYEAFIVQYDLNTTDKERMAQGFEIDLAGKVNYYPLKSFDVSNISNARSTPNCFQIITTWCSGPGKHPGGYAPNGDECPYHESDIQYECIGGSGNSGGGSGISGGFSGGGSGGSSGGGTGLPEDTEITTPLSCSDCQTYEEAMAALWEEDIDDSELDPCISEILNSLIDLDYGISILIQEISLSDFFQWNLENQFIPDGDCPGIIYAYSSLDGDIATTFFDPLKLKNTSDIGIASIILHESIHAYLQYLYQSDNNIDKSYRKLFNKWTNSNEDYWKEHHKIYDDFFLKIANTLRNYGISKGYNLDFEIYEALAFGGLTSISEDDCNTQPAPWFLESVPNRIRQSEIIERIEIELTGKDKHGNNREQSGQNGGC